MPLTTTRLEIFDEYTRRQYLAKAPQRNPFGDDEEPTKFNDLDIYTRVKVLQQLSVWTLGNAERIRGMMPQEEDHLSWRIEPLGWDKEDRSYYVLDDNRLYRRTDEPPPPPTPQPKIKAKSASKSKRKTPSRGTRASKRRKLEESEDEELEEQPEADNTAIEDTLMTNGGDETAPEDPDSAGYGFTRKTWELVAVTLEEYQEFMASIFRSRDPNEKQLRATIEEDVMPIIEKRAEALQAKRMKKVRELENLQKMATAKRSSRLADKADKEAEARKEREAQEQRQHELKLAREEQERQKRIEEGHESRRLTREQRVREREAKRILHEEELARLEAEGERAGSQDVPNDDADADAKRASGRQRQTQREKHKKELEKLAAEDGSWYFDCSVCGQHGENMDDGSHSIACDRCNVWQHSKCHGYTPKQAEQETFTFICGTCKRKEADAQKPKIPPLKLHNRSSDTPETQKSGSRPVTANGQHMQQLYTSYYPGTGPQNTADYQKSPPAQMQTQIQETAGYRYPPVSNFAPRSVQVPQSNGQPNGPRSQAQLPLTNGNGQRAPSHHQQHQYAHNSAIATAGGHPPQAQHMFPHQQQHSHNPQQWQHYQQPNENLHMKQRPGSSQLMNGFQSPSKAAAKPPSPSPNQLNMAAPSYTPQPQWQPQHPYQPPQQMQTNNFAQQMQRSPDLAPPPIQRQQQSPVKSSPPRSAHLPMSSAVANYQQHYASHVQTPQMRESHANGASPNATQVAVDGMSGPWPSRSNDIPRKHDQPQSPVPPPLAQRVGDQRVLPPVTPLAPSPGQQSATAASSVPVKKMQLSPVMSSAESVGLPPVLSPPAPIIRPQIQAQPPPTPVTVHTQPGAMHETKE